MKAATQIYQHWKTELEHTNEELNELEKPENVRLPGKERKQEEFCAALTQFEQACNDLATREEALRLAYNLLASEEAVTAPLRNEATATEKTLLRNQERAQPETKSASQVSRLPQTARAEECLLTIKILEKINHAREGNIEPPQVLNKIYETIGRALLHQKRREEATEQPQTITGQGSRILLPEIRNPKPEDMARWEASQIAEDFIEERNDVIAAIERRTLTNALSQARAASEEETSGQPATQAAGATSLFGISEEEKRDSEGSEKNYKEPSNETMPLLPQRRLQKKNKETASSITTKSKSNRSESSIGSFVTPRTGASRAASIAASIPKSVISAASKLEMKGLKAATRAINEMANKWADLVRKADAERVAMGGAPYLDEETLFDA